jgi:hypothetical protein
MENEFSATILKCKTITIILSEALARLDKKNADG